MTEHLKIELRSLDNNLESEGEGLLVKGYVNETNSWSQDLVGKPKTLRSRKLVKWKERVLPGVFSEALSRAQKVDFLAEHQKEKILASTKNGSLQLIEDDRGLYMEAKISETSWGRDYFTLITDRLIEGMSFGMKVLEDKWYYVGNELRRDILKIDIYEISAVKNPAYPVTTLESRGIDVIDNVIPDESEEEALVNEENVTEITPKSFYTVLLKIDEKLGKLLEDSQNNSDQGVQTTQEQPDQQTKQDQQKDEEVQGEQTDTEQSTANNNEESEKTGEETPKNSEEVKEEEKSTDTLDESKKEKPEESKESSEEPSDEKPEESDQAKDADKESTSSSEEDKKDEDEDEKKKKNPFEKRSLDSLIEFFAGCQELTEE